MHGITCGGRDAILQLAAGLEFCNRYMYVHICIYQYCKIREYSHFFAFEWKIKETILYAMKGNFHI